MSIIRKEKQNIKNVFQIKQKLRNILQNLEELELTKDSIQTNSIALNLKVKYTNHLLNALEKAPLEKFAKIVHRRRRKRKNKKIKLNKNKSHETIQPKKDNTPSGALQQYDITKQTIDSKVKPNHQFRNDAQRFLRKFELLKMLHMARGQDAEETRKFANDFNRIRRVWNGILITNSPQHIEHQNVEDQWDEVFFGVNEPVYYGSEIKGSDFLQIRQTWDSYLTDDNKYGSSIPVGWVVPNDNASDCWTKYRSNENSE